LGIAGLLEEILGAFCHKPRAAWLRLIKRLMGGLGVAVSSSAQAPQGALCPNQPFNTAPRHAILLQHQQKAKPCALR